MTQTQIVSFVRRAAFYGCTASYSSRARRRRSHRVPRGRVAERRVFVVVVARATRVRSRCVVHEDEFIAMVSNAWMRATDGVERASWRGGTVRDDHRRRVLRRTRARHVSGVR